MMMNKQWLSLVIGSCLSISMYGQIQVQYDTIPFRIVHGKFIIKAEVNGHPAHFILDTGGINALVKDSADVYGIHQATGQQSFTGVNNASMTFKKGQLDSLQVGRLVRLTKPDMTIVPNNGFFRTLGVAGILGGECFRSVCLTIDKAKLQLRISYPYRPKGIPRSAGTLMNFATGYYSLIPVDFGGQTCQVLFDTGMPGIISMARTDFQRIRQSARITQRGYGFTQVGIGGIKYTQADSLYQIRIPKLTLPGGQVFTDVGALVQPQSQTLIGQGILDYGVVMLDYPRKLFYFFPYEQKAIGLAEVTTRWNVNIMPVDGHFEVTAVTGNCRAHVGDRVWNINGIDLNGLEQSQLAVDEIMEAISGQEAWILTGKHRDNPDKIIIEKR